MTVSLVGYQLLDASGVVVQCWGGVPGQYPSVPDMIVLPNGDQVHCPAVGDQYENWTLQNWMMDSPPPPPVVITFLQFMALFTPAEQAAIVGSADIQVKLFLLMASGAGEITLSDQEVATGINYLTSANLIAVGRSTQILANTPPS